jgi:hypothetical protein
LYFSVGKELFFPVYITVYSGTYVLFNLSAFPGFYRHDSGSLLMRQNSGKIISIFNQNTHFRQWKGGIKMNNILDIKGRLNPYWFNKVIFKVYIGNAVDEKTVELEGQKLVVVNESEKLKPGEKLKIEFLNRWFVYTRIPRENQSPKQTI